MAFSSDSPLFRHLRVPEKPDPEVQSIGSGNDRNSGVLGWLSYEVFRKDMLDRKLESHHITGIGFSGAVGIGLFSTSGEIIALGGPVGAFLAFIFAGLVIFSVMRCLAEMVSVRPVTAPLIDFPHTFVDEALGFTAGLMYWLANLLAIEFWNDGGNIRPPASPVLHECMWCTGQYRLTSLVSQPLIRWTTSISCEAFRDPYLNSGQLYGRMEWVFKWLKIALLIGVCILMMLIRAGVGPGKVDSNFEISPGFSPTGFFADRYQAAIPGTGGRILAVWTCTTMAMFQFMGGEIVLVTAGEAKRPMRDLPIAARYMYLLPISFYLVAILLVGLNVNYLDPRIYHSHVSYYNGARLEGIQTAARSPFVIAVENAGIRALPGFLDACFIFSALTAANTALYVSSRTLFTLAQRSTITSIRSTLGRTNNGHTPLAAITVSFLPGALAFLAVRSRERAFQEPIHVLSRLYTGPVLCIYAAQCLAFLRFLAATKYYKRTTINRDAEEYRDRHYRAHWQPLWAILGLVLCTLLMVFSGWSAIYKLCAESPGVDRGDAIVDLVASYLGPLFFFAILIAYKVIKRTRIRTMGDMSNVWFVREASETEDDAPKGRKPRNRFYEFLSWVK
ncbi:MAG: hypothetical protein L6R35_002346 [Caloplaca aegaea]|nr:MAG: hypothetical protein L6R35_002346 [Caloplaca aegaea]